MPRDDHSAADGYSVRARGTRAETHTLRGQLLADTDREQARQELGRAGKLLRTLDQGSTATPAGPRHPEALRVLGRAVTEKQYRERHPADVRRLRAFEALAGEPEFEKPIARLQPE